MTSERLHAAIHAALDSPIASEGTRVIRRPGWYQVINPSLPELSENELMLSHLREEEVDRVVDETFAQYAAHRLPFKWCIGPMSSPDALEKRIAPRAAAHWGFRGMAIDSAMTEVGTAGGTTVELVGPENFQDFYRLNLEGWEIAPSPKMERKLRLAAEHPKSRSYLVRDAHGEAVGAAGTLLKDGFGYLVGAVVLPRARGKGAYRALISGRLADLSRNGYPFAVTLAREATSAPILEKLGFETAYRAKIYRFD